MSGKGTLHRGSLLSRVLEFFAENPDEELDYDSLTAKFGVSYLTARRTVSRATRRGDLESVHVIRPKAKGRAS